jgi:hypothetical protein
VAIAVDGLQVAIVIGAAVGLGHLVVYLMGRQHAAQALAVTASAHAAVAGQDALAGAIPGAAVATFVAAAAAQVCE